MEKSLKKLTQIVHICTLISIKLIKILMESIPAKETPGPVQFTSELSHTFKKWIAPAPWSHKFDQDINNSRHFVLESQDDHNSNIKQNH